MLQVSLLGCNNYSNNDIHLMLLRHFDNLGGIAKFISYGDRVVVKPNLICPKPSDIPAQTHPAMILELVKILLDVGAKPLVCDSPAWADARSCVDALGVLDELTKLGVEVKDLNSPKMVKIPHANVKTGVSRILLDADKVINLPKLKAHQQMVASIAIKNMFGAVVGKRKGIWHFRKGSSVSEFSKLILGIYEVSKPTLNIIDAIVAMESQGPINGIAKPLGFTMAGEDAFACEILCAKIIGLSKEEVPLIREAMLLGLTDCEIEDIEIVGEDLAEFVVDDFVHAQLTPLRFTLPRILRSIVRQIVLLSKHKFLRK